MFAIEFICLAGALLVSVILVSIQVCFSQEKQPTNKQKAFEQQLLRSLRGINYQLKRQAECSEHMVKVAALHLLHQQEATTNQQEDQAHQEEEEEEELLSRFRPDLPRAPLGEECIPM